MATVQFIFTGKIRPVKDTEKLKGFETKVFDKNKKSDKDSCWANQTVKFNAIEGNSRFLFQCQAGYWDKNGILDEKKTTIYTSRDNKDGTKPEQIQVKYADRLDPDIVANVPTYKKFILDTEVYGRRAELEDVIKAFADGSVTDEQKEKLGVTTKAEAETALEKSRNKRHEYISAIDFVPAVNKLLHKENADKRKWTIYGTIDFRYDPAKDVHYRTFNITRIYLAADDAEEKMTATFEAYYNKNSLDAESLEEKKKVYLNAYTRYYDSQYKNDACKGNIPAPVQFTIDATDEKKAKVLQKRLSTFDNDDEWRVIGLNIDVVDGAEQLALDESMLTPDQLEDLECGLTTMAQLRRELGGTINGEKISAYVITGFARGYSSGSKPSAFTDDDFGKPQHDEKVEEEVEETEEDNDVDLFDDDEL